MRSPLCLVTIAQGSCIPASIFRMRVIVVKTRAVRKHEVAFDFPKQADDSLSIS